MSGLALNLKKSYVVPLFDIVLADFKRILNDISIETKKMIVSCSAKYLGVYVGIGANTLSWDAPLAKFNKTVGDIVQHSLGFIAGMFAYNSKAISKFSH